MDSLFNNSFATSYRSNMHALGQQALDAQAQWLEFQDAQAKLARGQFEAAVGFYQSSYDTSVAYAQAVGKSMVEAWKPVATQAK